MGKSSNDQVGWLHPPFNLETHPDGVTLPDRLANFGLDLDIETLPANSQNCHEQPPAKLVVENDAAAAVALSAKRQMTGDCRSRWGPWHSTNARPSRSLPLRSG